MIEGRRRLVNREARRKRWLSEFLGKEEDDPR